MEVHGNVTINNLIEKQEITVENGGVLNFGAPQVEGEEAERLVEMTKEDECRLLPLFKGDIHNLRQFFGEAKKSEPVQIIANVNSWIANGKISTEFKMKDLWKALNDLNIYKHSYQSWNKQVKK